MEPNIDSWTSSATFLGPTDLTTAQVRDRFNALIDIAATRIRGNLK